ncbi:GumC family protein [Bacteroides fragilis]
MDYVLYLLRALYRVKWWILLGTALITAIVYFRTGNLKGGYNVEATLYTGVVSGYGVEESTKVDWALAQNSMDNLINIIQAESTLKRVSLRLFSRILVKGSPDKDNEGITAASYNYTYNHMKNSPDGKALIALIDRTSEDKTMENFQKYERQDKNNYIYGLFYFQHFYYSYQALKNIKVERKGSSDLLKVSYQSGDPGIAYNTIEILMKEFVNEYQALRYEGTDKVIEYFKAELKRIGGDLTKYEDDLTQYNVENRIINYYDETKEIAAINKEFELREQNVLFEYNSSRAMLEELERQMDANSKRIIHNVELVDKLKQATNLTGKIIEMETISTAGDSTGMKLTEYKNRLIQSRRDLSTIANQYVAGQQTKEGVAKATIVEQWLDQLLLFEKAKAELKIVQRSRSDLNAKYTHFAPVGTTIKRKERTISFTEQNYLTNLKSYNDALLRKKNLEMTAAILKVLNPPAYPINEEVASRKKIVMMAAAGSFIFFVALFLLIEAIDRTLRDSTRTRKQTGSIVLGAYPAPLKLSPISKQCEEIATRYMSSAILRFFTERKEGMPFILNLLSTEQGSGKTYLAEQLQGYWESIGLKVRRLTDGTDFNSNSSAFTLAKNLTDLYTPGTEDILIVEYPSLEKANIPTPLLQDAQLNLLVASAVHGWKATDKVLLQKLKSQLGTSPYLYLNRAPKYEVETYTGMLPPYTFVHKQMYRLSQLALTESLFNWKKNSRKKPQDIDDDDDE